MIRITKKNNLSTKLKTRKFGFTLLETLVALAVFSLAIWGPVNLALYSMRVSHYARNQVIAFYLGQEAIEYVRNIRDSNALMGNDWFEHGPGGANRYINRCMNPSGCCIDVFTEDIYNWADPKCGGEAMLYDSSNGRYNYDSGVSSGFARRVWIENPFNGNDYEAQITVEMSWEDIFFDKSFSIQEHIFDWK